MWLRRLAFAALAVGVAGALHLHSPPAAAPCVRLSAVELAGGTIGVTATASANTSASLAASASVSALLLSYSLPFADPLVLGGDAPPPPQPLNTTADPGTWSGNLSIADLALPDGTLVLLRVVPEDHPNCSAAELGLVVGIARIAASSAVPPLFIYCNDTAGMETDHPTPASIVFDPSGADASDGFYGHVRIRRAGSDRKNPSAAGILGKSKDWPKHKLALSFHNSSRLMWRNVSSPRAGFGSREVELRSMYAESGPTAYMREALALRLFQAAGVPAADSRYVRVFLNNGTFHGLYLLTERVDEDWLAERGFGNGTVLWSTEHYKYSNLVRPRDCGGECLLRMPLLTPSSSGLPTPALTVRRRRRIRTTRARAAGAASIALSSTSPSTRTLRRQTSRTTTGRSMRSPRRCLR